MKGIYFYYFKLNHTAWNWKISFHMLDLPITITELQIMKKISTDSSFKVVLLPAVYSVVLAAGAIANNVI